VRLSEDVTLLVGETTTAEGSVTLAVAKGRLSPITIDVTDVDGAIVQEPFVLTAPGRDVSRSTPAGARQAVVAGTELGTTTIELSLPYRCRSVGSATVTLSAETAVGISDLPDTPLSDSATLTINCVTAIDAGVPDSGSMMPVDAGMGGGNVTGRTVMVPGALDLNGAAATGRPGEVITRSRSQIDLVDVTTGTVMRTTPNMGVGPDIAAGVAPNGSPFFFGGTPMQAFDFSASPAVSSELTDNVRNPIPIENSEGTIGFAAAGLDGNLLYDFNPGTSRFELLEHFDASDVTMDEANSMYGPELALAESFLVLTAQALILFQASAATLLQGDLAVLGPLSCDGLTCAFPATIGREEGFITVDLGTDPPTVGDFVASPVTPRSYDLIENDSGFTIAAGGGFPGDLLALLRYGDDLTLTDSTVVEGDTIVDGTTCTAAVDPTFVDEETVVLPCFNEGSLRVLGIRNAF